MKNISESTNLPRKPILFSMAKAITVFIDGIGNRRPKIQSENQKFADFILILTK